MLAYFCTQQDISVEHDRDDRRRRQLLRLKCLYVISACSLLSLFILVCLVQSDAASWSFDSVTHLQQQALLWFQRWPPGWRNEL